MMTKTKRPITEIIPCIHQGSPESSWKEVDRQSRRVGSMAGPYHFFIPCSGKLEVGRPVEWASGHACGSRSASLCISVGINIPEGKKFTEHQRETFEALVKAIQQEYPKAQLADVAGLKV